MDSFNEPMRLATGNIVSRMADSYKFQESCDTIVKLVHQNLINNWSMFIESDIGPFCKELQTWIEKNIFSTVLKKICDTDTLRTNAKMLLRPYMSNVKSIKLNEEHTCILYGVRYIQSITNERFATLRGSGGWFIVNTKDLSIVDSDILLVYHKVGQDFTDAINGLQSNDSEDIRKYIDTFKTLASRELTIKADGSHVRIHKLKNNYILLATQMLEYVAISKIDFSNPTHTIMTLLNNWMKIQSKTTNPHGLYGILCWFLFQTENNTIQLEMMTPEHPGYSEKVGYSVMVHDPNVLKLMIDQPISFDQMDLDQYRQDIEFIEKHSLNNPTLNMLVPNMSQIWEFIGIEEPQNSSDQKLTYGKLTRNVILVLFSLLSNIKHDNKRTILLALENDFITHIVNSPKFETQRKLASLLTILLDLLLLYLGDGDVPEGLILGIELKIKTQFWKMAHGSTSSPEALFAPVTNASIENTNIPSLIQCRNHMNNLVNHAERILPGTDIVHTLDSLMNQMGLFGLVIMGLLKVADPTVSDVKTICKKLASGTDNTFENIQLRLASADILFDYDGTVDSKEKIELLGLLSREINVCILSARGENSIKSDVMSRLEVGFPANIQIVSISDHFNQLMKGPYFSPVAAIFKSLLISDIPSEKSIKLFDDSRLVASMFKSESISDYLIDADKMTTGLFTVKVAITLLEKLSNDHTKQINQLNYTRKIKTVLELVTLVTNMWYNWDISPFKPSTSPIDLNDSDTLTTSAILPLQNSDTEANKTIIKSWSVENKIMVGLVTGAAGSGKSTLVRDFFITNDFSTTNTNCYVFAKDIAHFNYNNGVGSYSFNYINAQAAQDLARELAKLSNKSSDTTILVILDGVSFDKMGATPPPTILLQSITYELDEYLKMINRSERRLLSDVYSQIILKLEGEQTGKTLEARANESTDHETNISNAAKIIKLITNKQCQNNELMWTGLAIDKEPVLDELEKLDWNEIKANTPPGHESINKNTIMNAIRKKPELHTFTHYRNDYGFPSVLVALFMLKYFDNVELVIDKLVCLYKNNKIGAVYLNVTLKSKKTFEFSKYLSLSGHITLAVNFLNAGTLHLVTGKPNITPVSISLKNEIVIKPELTWLFKDYKTIKNELNMIPDCIIQTVSTQQKQQNPGQKGQQNPGQKGQQNPGQKGQQNPGQQKQPKQQNPGQQKQNPGQPNTASETSEATTASYQKYLKYKQKYLQLKNKLT
jgi:hypothetical protein